MGTSVRKFGVFVLFVIALALAVSCSSQESEIPQAPSKNVSVVAFLQDVTVIPGGILHYNMTLTNLGKDKGFDVAIEHRLFSSPLGRSVKSEGEIVHLDQPWVYKDKALAVPSDAPPGDYQLTVAISYGGNQSAQAGAFFSVVAPIEEVNKSKPASSSNGSDLPIIEEPSPVSNSSSSDSSSTKDNVTASAPAPVGKEVIIEHKERAFVPEKVTIEPGTTVVWIQRDKTSADVAGPGFHSQPLGPGKEFRHTFKKVGIFDFYSQLTKAGGSVIVEDPDKPNQFGRDPMSFKGSLRTS